jgi:hypothetical protein
MPWISLNTTDAAALQTTLRELESDSDRAAGIVGAALVDESLTALLKSRLHPDQRLIQKMFRSSGPLGAFSVKITMGFLMRLYSHEAQRELETIKDIRNEFAHRIARSFQFDNIRDLANNLSLSEKVEFYITNDATEQKPAVLYIGAGSKPADRSVEPVLPPIKPERLVPRERYIRACQFYSGALLLAGHASPLVSPAPVLF